jgi:hypothetical protein
VAKAQAKQFAVCVDNDGYPASLEKRKIYVALCDTEAEKLGLLRIVDESGDDYLYPKAFFRSIALPQAVRKAVLAAAWLSAAPRHSANRCIHELGYLRAGFAAGNSVDR